MVSNKTGQDVVPVDPLSRRFVDEVERCDTVLYCVAGLPQVLKGVL